MLENERNTAGISRVEDRFYKAPRERDLTSPPAITTEKRR